MGEPEPGIEAPTEGAEAAGSTRWFHLVFAFLGIFSAEALSGNLPAAPLLPPMYLVYGCLYYFFVDSLLRRRVRSWTTVYLYGVLVGYVTESFAAKVMWFGWPDNSANLLGILPWPEFPLLAFFFHPLFSFTIPVYLARRYLDFPFALETSPRLDRWLPWLWPLFAVFQVRVTGIAPGTHCLVVAIDAAVFLFFVSRLRARGRIPDLRFTPPAKTRLGLLLVGSYLLFLWKLPPFRRSEMIHPNALQLGFALAFTALVVGMVWTRIRSLPDDQPVAYDPGQLSLATLARYAAYLVGSQILGVALLLAVPLGLVKLLWVLVFLSGTFYGTWFFLRELARTRWRKPPPTP